MRYTFFFPSAVMRFSFWQKKNLTTMSQWSFQPHHMIFLSRVCSVVMELHIFSFPFFGGLKGLLVHTGLKAEIEGSLLKQKMAKQFYRVHLVNLITVLGLLIFQDREIQSKLLTFIFFFFHHHNKKSSHACWHFYV